jgi:hypothetical protein
MDSIVTFNKVAGFLCNSPPVAPHPDFAKLRALRQHIVKALKQLKRPQSFIHGWSGLTMTPAMYALLKHNPFVLPGDPGPAPVYTPFATPAAIKMIDAAFEQDKKYFLTYKNINCECFWMLKDLFPNQYMVSNTSALNGWNAMMLIQVILNQLEDLYGKPLAVTLFANDDCSRALSLQPRPPSSSSITSNNARRS